MPGPRNSKKKGKLQAKKEKRTKVSTRSLDNQPCPLPPQRRPLPPTPSPIATPLHPTTPPHINPEPHSNEYSYVQEPLPPGFYNHQQDVAGFALPKKPFIQDPGNGPRVRDIQAFLASSFAAPPSLEDELCAEFAQEELLQMLCSILPQETAMILWYNKSRLRARICPACHRLYHLGDSLQDPIGLATDDPETRSEGEEHTSEHRYREQQISGLCSPLCFILAAFNYPAAIRSTWGRMAEDLSDETWDALDESARRTEDDRGLGMLLKMTRCHDLGLGQLFFPGEDMDQEDEVVSPSLVEDSVEPRRSSEHPAAGHQNQCTHEPTPH